MKASCKSNRAFTIIELLVVVAIIGVLLGLLMPALSGAKKQSAKANEMNSLKQVGYAWQMYASNNGDAALPGYLEIPVQAPPVMGMSRGWGVKYQYPDRSDVPPAPTFSGGNPNVAGPWTWRLLSYLDYSHEMVHGYLREDDSDKFSMMNEAMTVAEQPAFGYNGFYIGGYWQMQTVDGVQTPLYRYYDHCFPGNVRLSVPMSPAQINRSSDMVLFCSAAKIDNTRPWWSSVKLPPDFPGWHLVTPPTVATEKKWRPYEQDPNGVVEVLAGGDVYAPIGRFTGTIATLLSDGHCDTNSFNSLYDQRKWVNNAPGSRPDVAANWHNTCFAPP